MLLFFQVQLCEFIAVDTPSLRGIKVLLCLVFFFFFRPSDEEVALEEASRRLPREP